MAATTGNTLEFIGETLSAAEGRKFAPEKYQHLLDELFAAALQDPMVQMAVVVRKGDDVAVMGLKDGVMASRSNELRQILLPVATRL